MTKALIVGGGITGLATAIVLSRQGIDVDLVERQSHVSTLGSGITLIGAALRTLDRLGLYPECVANGYPVTHLEAYEVDGTLANRSELPSPVGTGQPGMLGMMRPTLHRILLITPRMKARKSGLPPRRRTSSSRRARRSSRSARASAAPTISWSAPTA